MDSTDATKLIEAVERAAEVSHAEGMWVLAFLADLHASGYVIVPSAQAQPQPGIAQIQPDAGGLGGNSGADIVYVGVPSSAPLVAFR